jgi:hypothetical protein
MLDENLILSKVILIVNRNIGDLILVILVIFRVNSFI